jgi:Ca2+-binding RTX toxin-like protein
MGQIVYRAGTLEDDAFILTPVIGTQYDVRASDGDDILGDTAKRRFATQDFFYGEDGNDTIISKSGFDLLDGGAGDDTLVVRASRYRNVPGSHNDSHEWRPFDVEVVGGDGHDVLTVKNARGYTIETRGDDTLIHTRFDGVITVTGVEEFHFVL